MQRLEVSCAVQPIYGSFGAKGLTAVGLTPGGSSTVRPVFTHGPQGPGPRAENFQGWRIKKNRI
jgi:hypothetical protein